MNSLHSPSFFTNPPFPCCLAGWIYNSNSTKFSWVPFFCHLWLIFSSLLFTHWIFLLFPSSVLPLFLPHSYILHYFPDLLFLFLLVLCVILLLLFKSSLSGDSETLPHFILPLQIYHSPSYLLLHTEGSKDNSVYNYICILVNQSTWMLSSEIIRSVDY